MKKIIILDTETGGLNHKTDAILTISLKEFNKNPLFNFYVFNEMLNITSEALLVNKLNINEHKKIALTEKDCVDKLKVIFNYYDKPMLCGQNIQFDIAFLSELFKRQNENLFDYIYYNSLDLKQITFLLNFTGIIDVNSLSLQSVCEYFAISENFHTSEGDVIAAEKLLNIYVDFLKRFKEQNEKIRF